MYTYLSFNENETGIYDSHAETENFNAEDRIASVKVTYREEGESFIAHSIGLINKGYSREEVKMFIHMRMQGKDKKYPIYYVVISDKYNGLYSKEDHEKIPDTESIHYRKKLYVKESAIKHFDSMTKQHGLKYFTVLSRRIQGVFTNLDNVEQLTKGFSDVYIRKYDKLSEAEEALNHRKSTWTDEVTATVDGSYSSNTELSGYGFVLSNKSYIVYEEKGITVAANDLRHINGELQASMNSILKAIELGFKKINIRYDFNSTEQWAYSNTRSKNESVQFVANKYRRFIENNSKFINISFEKVKGHSGDYFNDRADFLAKQASGVIKPTIEQKFPKKIRKYKFFSNLE